MTSLLRSFRKLLLLVRRERFHRELDEEMAFHRAMVEEELYDSAMPIDEARHAAKRRFGNDLQLKEQSHEVVGFRFENVFGDLRFAARQMRKNPGFAVTAIVVLALGIAASVSIFAFVEAALLKPMPYANPTQLMSVSAHSNACEECELSYPDYLDWKKSNKVFSSLEAWTATSYLWKSAAGVESLRAARVSGGFFHSLGVEPMLGRGFTEADDRPSAPRTVVLSYGTWQRWFGGHGEIIGQTVMLDDAAYTVIGVLPREFNFAERAAELWTTIHDHDDCRGCRSFIGVGRLKDGVSVKAAQADMQSIAAQLEKAYPDADRSMGARVIPLSDAFIGGILPLLLVLLSGAGLLLVIAYVNVASLLLVRAENRKREMALRGALGASRARLVQQFVTEGLALVAAAVGLGLAAAYVAMHLLVKLIPERVFRGMPYFAEVGLHPRVLLFAGAVSLLAVVVFTVTPMLRLSIEDLRGDLAEGGRGSAGTAWKRFGANLVAAELAIAMVLLACAGLLGKSLYRLLHVDLNFQPEHVATLEIDSLKDGEDKIVLLQRVLTRISAMPGVVSAAQTSGLPVTCNCSSQAFRVQGKPWNGEHNSALMPVVSEDYFRTLQVRLVRGRFFSAADNAQAPAVVMINRTLAKRYFSNEDPIGRVIGDETLSPKSLKRIVGVVDDLREGGLDDEIAPAVYAPFAQNADNGIFIVVRTEQDAGAMIPALAAAIREVEPDAGVRNEFTMVEHIGYMAAAYLRRASAWLVGGFAAVALVLGVIGLYGVVAYSVGRRTREIGVRMALGAQRAAVYRLILGEAGLVTAVGVAAGLGCSIAAALLMRGLLFGVAAWDASTLLAVAAVLTACALAASFVPARRAARVNPVEALRAE